MIKWLMNKWNFFFSRSWMQKEFQNEIEYSVITESIYQWWMKIPGQKKKSNQILSFDMKKKHKHFYKKSSNHRLLRFLEQGPQKIVDQNNAHSLFVNNLFDLLIVKINEKNGIIIRFLYMTITFIIMYLMLQS